MYIIVMYVIMRIDSVIFIPYLFLIAERCVSAMKKKVPLGPLNFFRALVS